MVGRLWDEDPTWKLYQWHAFSYWALIQALHVQCTQCIYKKNPLHPRLFRKGIFSTELVTSNHHNFTLISAFKRLVHL